MVSANRAHPHTAIKTGNLPYPHFSQQLISLNQNVEWPPYSPDLAPPDFLCRHQKDRIYAYPGPKYSVQLKDNIRRDIWKPIFSYR